eukprot:g2439.t1
MSCLNPPLYQVPTGEWHCPRCTAWFSKGKKVKERPRTGFVAVEDENSNDENTMNWGQSHSSSIADGIGNYSSMSRSNVNEPSGGGRLLGKRQKCSRVGTKFQATLPPLGSFVSHSSVQRNILAKSTPPLSGTWRCRKCNFCTKSKALSVGFFANIGCPTERCGFCDSSRSESEYTAYQNLSDATATTTSVNSNRCTHRIEESCTLCRSDFKEWTMVEAKMFSKSVRLNDKNFREVAEEMNTAFPEKERTVRDIVQYYYCNFKRQCKLGFKQGYIDTEGKTSSYDTRSGSAFFLIEPFSRFLWPALQSIGWSKKKEKQQAGEKNKNDDESEGKKKEAKENGVEEEKGEGDNCKSTSSAENMVSWQYVKPGAESVVLSSRLEVVRDIAKSVMRGYSTWNYRIDKETETLQTNRNKSSTKTTANSTTSSATSTTTRSSASPSSSSDSLIFQKDMTVDGKFVKENFSQTQMVVLYGKGSLKKNGQKSDIIPTPLPSPIMSVPMNRWSQKPLNSLVVAWPMNRAWDIVLVDHRGVRLSDVQYENVCAKYSEDSEAASFLILGEPCVRFQLRNNTTNEILDLSMVFADAAGVFRFREAQLCVPGPDFVVQFEFGTCKRDIPTKKPIFSSFKPLEEERNAVFTCPQTIKVHFAVRACPKSHSASQELSTSTAPMDIAKLPRSTYEFRDINWIKSHAALLEELLSREVEANAKLEAEVSRLKAQIGMGPLMDQGHPLRGGTTRAYKVWESRVIEASEEAFKKQVAALSKSMFSNVRKLLSCFPDDGGEISLEMARESLTKRGSGASGKGVKRKGRPKGSKNKKRKKSESLPPSRNLSVGPKSVPVVKLGALQPRTERNLGPR